MDVVTMCSAATAGLKETITHGHSNQFNRSFGTYNSFVVFSRNNASTMIT